MPDLLYLDHAATSPMSAELREFFMGQLSACFANSETLHEAGLNARESLERARHHFARVLGCHDNEMIFTSGGTESNNLALHAAARHHKGKGVIWVSATAHPSLLEPAMHLVGEWQAVPLPCTKAGIVNHAALPALPRPDILALEWVNSEAGFIQPLAQVIAAAKAANPGVLVVVDGVQGFGKLPLPDLSHVYAFCISGHKIGAPIGVGGLMLRERLVSPLLLGGGQEGGWRPGTVAVPAIATFWQAYSTRAVGSAAAPAFPQGLRVLRDAQAEYTPFILMIDTSPAEGEVLMHHLEQKKIIVGLGSACSASRRKVSPTHKAMGLDDRLSRRTIRLSTVPGYPDVQLQGALAAIVETIRELERYY